MLYRFDFGRVLRCFIACIAMFPLSYGTIYLSDLYKRSVPAATREEQETLIDAIDISYPFLFLCTRTYCWHHLTNFRSGSCRTSKFILVCRVPRGMVTIQVTWYMQDVCLPPCVTSLHWLPCIECRTAVHSHHHYYRVFIGYIFVGSILPG